MNDIILWIYVIIMAIGLSSVVLVPLLGFCYHVTKIKMKELQERIDL